MGAYDVSYTGGLNSLNYIFQDNFDSINELTINPAILQVTPNTQTVVYGSPISFTPSFIGFVNGENALTAGITGNAVFGNFTVNVGTYNVNYVGGLSSQNYSFTDNTASTHELTIVPETLNIQQLLQTPKSVPLEIDFNSFDIKHYCQYHPPIFN